MEIMYWTFPDRSGKWSVCSSSMNAMECSGTKLVVDWDCGVPVIRHLNTRGTRWVEGPAVQRGVLTDPDPVWKTQVGGQHYTDMKIQPFQFSMANNLDPMQHTIVKYVTRFRAKNGLQDLEKAKQTIDLLIAYEKEQGRG